MTRLLIASVLMLAACDRTGTEPPTTPEGPRGAEGPSTPTGGVSYEVHEWGLVHGTARDTTMLSGPHAEPPPVPLAKPVLYFHREGEGALEIDVEVRLRSGRIVEHWPGSGVASPGGSIVWRGVLVQEGACASSRYPTLAEAPCSTVADGCEAATLQTVETHDADCVFYPPPPPPGGPTQAWNHLFYRGELQGAPPLPLRLMPQPDGTLRVTATGTAPIPGRLIRVHRAAGMSPTSDRAAVVDPPTPGATITVPAPAGPLSDAASALGEALAAAGLTHEEVAAFRRAWDETLFGSGTVAAAEAPTGPVAATPAIPYPESNAVVYLLPVSSADALSELHLDPAPRVVRRAIVAWVDEPQAP